LYFAWLGFYTLALIAPSVLGVFVFIAGIGSMGDQQVSVATLVWKFLPTL
jgi:hypothetical protein